jgi:hypothetical protein
MTTRPRKQLVKDVIPPSLKDLTEHRSVTLRVQWRQEERRWSVEVSPATAKKLLASFDKHEELSKDRAEQQRVLGELQKRVDVLERNNAALMKNIAADKRPDRYTKSPGNYFTAAEGRGLTTQVGGGIPGLGKRR